MQRHDHADGGFSARVSLLTADIPRAGPIFTGILPAAGAGSRLGGFRYPKELLPVVYVSDAAGRQARPMPVAEYSLQAMRHAQVDRCLVVISDSKTEVVHYFGDGSELPLPLAYLYRGQPKGLADAVDAGYRWTADTGSYTCLALPDTIFQPITALATICERIIAVDADVVLGLFPTEHPELLGPVRLDPAGRAVEVLEKPAHTDLYNTWGVAVWSPRFAAFLHEFLASNPTESGRPDLSVSQVFNAAIGKGYNVRGVFFEDGSYLDVGTADGIASLLLPAHLAKVAVAK